MSDTSVGVTQRSSSWSNSSEPEAAVTMLRSSWLELTLSSDLAADSSRECADLKETTDDVSVTLSGAEEIDN